MQKITLTKSDIKKEALNQIFSLTNFVYTALLLVLIICFFGLLDPWKKGESTPFLKATVIFIGISIVLFLIELLYDIFQYVIICVGKHSVKTAVLGNKKASEGSRYRIGIFAFTKFYQPPKLIFSDNMRFVIDDQYTYYKWTQNLRMLGKELFESSVIGDEFYLITIGKKEKKLC